MFPAANLSDTEEGDNPSSQQSDGGQNNLIYPQNLSLCSDNSDISDALQLENEQLRAAVTARDLENEQLKAENKELKSRVAKHSGRNGDIRIGDWATLTIRSKYNLTLQICKEMASIAMEHNTSVQTISANKKRTWIDFNKNCIIEPKDGVDANFENECNRC